MASGSFGSTFSSAIGSIGNFFGNASGIVNNFIAQRNKIRIASARAAAELARVKRSLQVRTQGQRRRTVSRGRNQRGRRASNTSIGGLPQNIAGIPTITILLLVGGVMVFKVLK